MDRKSTQNAEQIGRAVTSIDAAKANDHFEHFLNGSTLKTILGTYRNICDLLHLRPNIYPLFYPKLKGNLTSWRAKALWKKFDLRANNKVYGKGKLCPNTRVLIIGAGPCGLRTAIEAQLLGAKVVVVEKRDRMSRNNVLHLWPFVIDDLRLLGAKKFFGKFCAGAIDHISIRQLQCILLKVALLLGVEVHTEVSFERLIEPNLDDKSGWKAEFKPTEHPVSQFEFDVIIGADGKRNTLQGFKRKEFRGKLAIAITANFINKRTEAEARVEEISGVAFIFNQKFFKDLQADTGIDLENIVYYKDDTHYFVMTAKKQSLIDKGVIKQDLSDTAKLLAPDNVDRVKLMNYAREAAEFSTNYYMTDLEFAVNHYGQPDVAMFDFTSMYAAENASRIMDRHGYKLLTILVGDSLLEPFWPTGSGCARGFLSSLDAGWAIKGYGTGQLTPLEVLAERESIYRLLAQTTPENLNKDYKAYTLDPSTRYPNLNKNLLLPQQVLALYDSDNPSSIALSRVPATNYTDLPKKRRRRESHVDPDTLLVWIRDQIKEHEDLTVTNITTSFKDGRILCAIINHYRPDLLDYTTINLNESAKNNQIAFELLEKEIGISPIMTGEEMANSDVPDFLTMVSYLTQIYDTFRCEIPHIKHPKLNEPKILNILFPNASNKINEKSKFSMVNHRANNVENNMKIGDLNLLPIKSIEEYKCDNDQSKNSLNTLDVGNNSKSLILISEFEHLHEEKNHITNKVHKRSKPIKKNTNTGSKVKSAYLIESQILQAKIDAISHKNKLKKKLPSKNIKALSSKLLTPPKPPVMFVCEMLNSDKGVQTETIKPIVTESITNKVFPLSNHKNKVNNVIFKKTQTDDLGSCYQNHYAACCCCQANKLNLINHKDYNEKLNIKFDNEEIEIQEISNSPIKNCINIIFPKIVKNLIYGLGLNQATHCQTNVKLNCKCHEKYTDLNKLLSLAKMSHSESNCLQAEHTFDRVVNWISASNFEMRCSDSAKTSSIHLDGLTDITSVTRNKLQDRNDIIVEPITDLVKFNSDGTKNICKLYPEGRSTSIESITKFIEELKKTDRLADKKIMQVGSNKLFEKRLKGKSESPGICSIIVENEENELPETKRTDNAFTKDHPAIKASIINQPSTTNTNPLTTHRPSSRHKRHVELPAPSKALLPNQDRNKSRKRKTMDKLNFGNVEERMKILEEIAHNRCDRQSKKKQQRKKQTDQFIKSMQMLQANCKPDHSEPFEDYSIFLYRQTAANFGDRVKDLEKKFTYIPDRDRILPIQTKGEKDEDFQTRIKGMEDKWQESVITEKKPKDLLRAIGKIDNSDWNIKEIEKKIIENKLGKNVNKDKEKVPKWSREQFLARQTKMEKQHLERQDSTGGKFAEIDKNIKQLDQKLKEGTIRDMNQHKIALITEKLKPKAESENKPVKKSSSKTAVIYPTQGNSETCHFCSKRVYLMERLSAEGRFFHRGCFRCQYCHTTLRLGSYVYDKEGKHGYRFYCSQHFGMTGEIKSNKVTRKPSQRFKDISNTPENKALSGVAGVDLLDRVQTPERIEFKNLSTAASSDHEESISQMDEDEWTDKNFGASTAELGTSDDDSSSFSDTDSDDEDAYEEALEEPPTKEGTLKWAERYNRRYSRKHNDSESDDYSSSDRSSYYENSSGDDDTDTATEGEEEILARELRRQEVRVEPPVVHTDTGTDTEIASDDTSTESSSEVQNSATEISTDSEFAHDDPTPTREVPSIVFNDMFVTKTRGKYHNPVPQKVQITTKELQKPIVTNKRKDVELKFTPLVLTPIITKPAPSLLLRTEGYTLNRTQSTGGIATKVSLELKKKYLLGENNSTNSIQKSGSASTLDSKFKSFHSNISDCQKLLKAAPETIQNIQTYSNKLNECTSPVSPLFSPQNIFKDPAKSEEKKVIEEVIVTENNKVEVNPVFENVNEGRPRSPVHETSIIVPNIDWSQKLSNNIVSTSDSSSSSSDIEKKNMPKSPSVTTFKYIPAVEVQDLDAKDIPLDSLNMIDVSYRKLENQPISINDPPKSIASDKKALNQPKVLPILSNDVLLNQVHSVLHKPKYDLVSGRSTPSNESCNEQITAVLTETELSDWARDEVVSDDFEDVEYELNLELEPSRKHRKPKTIRKTKEDNTIASISELEDLKLKHICGKQKDVNNLTECVNSILYPNLENIEFMDTGTESSDDGLVEAKNNGYVQFQDEDDPLEDSLSPIINVVEVTNPKILATFDEDYDDISTITRNTGYCIIEQKNLFGGEVVDLKPTDLQKLKEKSNLYDNEEDSLLIIEPPSTTTEENTCSDSTVKNVAQLSSEIIKEQLPTSIHHTENNNTLDKKRLEDKLAQVKKDMKKISDQRKTEQIDEQNLRNNIEFEQHCQRLQSKVDFGNAKDSIDIRKSRRQSKSGSPPKPDLIQEEIEVSPIKTRKEQIEKERDINKKLIEEMVMNKMKSQNKSLERKRRTRNSFSPSISPSRPYGLTKSATTCISAHLNNPTPDVLLSTINNPPVIPVQKSVTVSAFSELNVPLEPKVTPRTKYTPLGRPNVRPLSVHTSFLTKNDQMKITSSLASSETFSLPDIPKALVSDNFQTPKPPPRYKNEEAKRVVEKLKEDARARAKLLSDEDLGLSPEDKLVKLRQRVNNKRGKENDIDIYVQDSIESLVTNRERRNSLLYSNDTLSKKKKSFQRSKSGDDHFNLTNIQGETNIKVPTSFEIRPYCIKRSTNVGEKTLEQSFKSDPNLLNIDDKKEKKKSKDRERRKSITKMFTDLFGKKKDSSLSVSSGNRGFLSRISPKTKDKSKDLNKVNEPLRRTSYTEVRWSTSRNVSPPPIPPLPSNYTCIKSGIDDSSEGESEWKRVDISSCDTIDQSGTQERRSSRSARKAARQSQLKRHRMAQEIQRKLEETEVKTRELEERGVSVEKALRGESSDSPKEETELLKEWFDLMRDMTELRRYERELMVRAQELELEDRHARLQHELKERLEIDGEKTQEDVETEGSIIREMMNIVKKRDTLITLLEDDRLRYTEEDKGFEEQMLAKGITLTPIMKIADE